MIISDIKVFENKSDEEVFQIACKKANVNMSNIIDWHIIKKSVDARRKDKVHFNYSFEAFLKGEEEPLTKNLLLVDNKKNLDLRPVVVGAGPAGLFAAYTLAINGYNPILLEQGKCIEDREKDVEDFINNRRINTRSNIQFGEGGAGTFSDGKLTTNTNSELNKIVLETFVKFGAPKEIMYLTKPHIGTDNLRKLVKNMREEIISLGGEVLFNTKVIDFEINTNEQKIEAVITEDGNSIKTNNVILAIGHSARSTFEKLLEKKVHLEPKPFSVGVRIEHLQKDINETQYGTKTKLKLPPAEYKFAYHGEDGRSCYTFCMCPGGYVMASSSEENTIVTNGMSYFDRSGENANSALLVTVMPEDYMKNDNPLNGMFFQKELEEKAFKMAGENYNAPSQSVGEYLGKSEIKETLAGTYKPGLTRCNLNKLFPEYINKTLKEGIEFFGTKLKGFNKDDSLLTAVESRSSSPVRITRDDDMNSNIKGLHPCGEGAGYAGGIMTAAIDGIKVAKAIVTKM